MKGMVITMKAYLKGNLYEGTADEISEFLKLTRQEQSPCEIIADTITTILTDGKVINEKIHRINDEENIENTENLDKKTFVSTVLCDCLKSANKDVKSCEYVKSKDYKLRRDCELVTVTMKNGATYIVDVTADSLMTMAADVFKFMMYK